MPRIKKLLIVISLSSLISAMLMFSLWDMNFWPTDTEVYYLPAAQKLPSLQHLSQIHESFDQEGVRWLHGKEILILLASVLQRWMHDSETLRPFIVLSVIAWGISSIFVYLIARRLWLDTVAWICYGIFLTSFWPYVYVIFTKHQPCGLMFFLASAFMLLLPKEKLWVRLFTVMLAGIFLGAALFSSTVSGLYLPFIMTLIGTIVYERWKQIRWRALGQILAEGLVFLAGILIIIIVVSYPNVLKNIKGFFEYVEISRTLNHFYYNQPVLQEWLTVPIEQTRGGLIWIFKYFMMVMPVMVPFCVIVVLYLFYSLTQKRNLDFKQYSKFSLLGAIVLSISPVLMTEIKQVAQYGANYFPAYVGLLFLIGFGLNQFLIHFNPTLKVKVGLVMIFFVHLGMNAYAYFDDVYPTRMATTFISRKIASLGVDHIYTYRNHPYSPYIVGQLNQKIKDTVSFIPVPHVYEPKEGYMLVPPMTDDSIYYAATGRYGNFDQDLFLNQLIKTGKIKDYAVASYKTLVSSRIWAQEEEILAYRYLVLNQFPTNKVDLGRTWILDAKKMAEAEDKPFPSEDELQLMRDHVRNIGTENRFYLYTGYKYVWPYPSKLLGFKMKIYKVGDPVDDLVLYVFYAAPKQYVWVPMGKNYMSKQVSGKSITSDSNGQYVLFEFPEAIQQPGGPFQIRIYRTGKPDDNNYYRVYSEVHQRIGDQ